MIVRSFCKVNLLLNILGKRSDGFHELETILYPIAVFDELTFSKTASGTRLTSNIPDLPTDASNLIVKAASLFFETTSIQCGIDIDLQKTIPIGAGLGGGSGNAAATLLALNSLFNAPASEADMHAMAAKLGSDIPFFLQSAPALGTGRGEKIRSLPSCRALENAWFVLVHPGFGVSTPWAYRALAADPENYAKKSLADDFIESMRQHDLGKIAGKLVNSLEAPVFAKYLLLPLIKKSLEESGAVAAMMSGSGSTVFGIYGEEADAVRAEKNVREAFGEGAWVRRVAGGKS